MKSIVIERLTVKYGDYTALKNITFSVEHPSFLVVMGPNGAGKTTLLKALMGQVDYEGKIVIFGKKPIEALDRMGYMPQRERINRNIPLKVKDVVLMPLISKNVFGISKEHIAMAKNALKIVGMESFWNSQFSSLSGGQQQRILLARTLARDPDILILDEPFSATDVATKLKLIEILHSLKKKKTIILVAHDINPLVECTDKVLLLNKEIIAFGTMAETLTEENMEHLYGTRIPIIRYGEVCYTVGSDSHIHI